MNDGGAGDQNLLLASLPPEDYERLRINMEPVRLVYRQHLYNAGEPILHVYFPCNGLVSQIVTMEDGSAVETGIVGREGMVGLSAFLGRAVSSSQSLVQIPGEAARIGVEELRGAAQESRALRELLQRYALALLNQVAQTAACNRLHPVEERCARWLLLAQDRAGKDVLPLTQELLSLMLGVRRASVSMTAAILQQAGLIRYLRGRIEIIDRPGLEAAACECYDIMSREADRVVA